MRRILSFFSILCLSWVAAQQVHLYKVEATSKNNSKVLLFKDEELPQSSVLGEIEVQGYSEDDEYVFSQIYTKAKSVGANYFIYLPFDNLDGPSTFSQSNYKIKLLYKEGVEDIPTENAYIYVFNRGDERKITVNKTTIKLRKRSFVKYSNTGQPIAIGTKGLLGSSIKVTPVIQSNYYFAIKSIGMKASESQTDGGLIFKSSDVTGVEKSFASFLSMIYQYQK